MIFLLFDLMQEHEENDFLILYHLQLLRLSTIRQLEIEVEQWAILIQLHPLYPDSQTLHFQKRRLVVTDL